MAPARIIDGTQIARDLRARVVADVAAFRRSTGIVPGLATLLVGEDPASEVYVRNKRKAAAEAGMADLHHHLDAGIGQSAIAELIAELSADDAVSGILLQLPLPKGLDSASLIDLIPPVKDVDGLTTVSAGLLVRGEQGLRPCTPSGVMALIDSTGIDLDGATAVVVGRSALVGGPTSRLLRRSPSHIRILAISRA
jgi:methylenetetrahydrofolate dehydrogenase (NADP+)/methenyltetrahydrofolate cyclohydrolase